MSFIQFRDRCQDCGLEWNAAFGMVMTSIIAQPPTQCPGCGSKNFRKVAYEWKWDACNVADCKE